MTKIKLFSVFLAFLLIISTVPSSAFEYAPEETLGTELLIGASLTHSKEWNINGEVVTISVEKV